MFNSRELIDTSTGEVLWHTQDHIRQTGVFSPDGSQVASAGYLDDYKAIQLYDANTGEHIRKLEGHRNWFQRCDGKQRELKKERDTVVQFLTYTGDGRILISAGDDGQIIGWDTETGRELYVYKAPCGRILELHLSPEGGVLAARHDGGIVLLDARTGGILFQKQGYIRRMAYDRTGGRLVVNWGTEDPRTEEPSIWRISYYSQSKEGGGTEKEKKINVTSSKLNLGQLVSKVLFSPDGEFLIGSKGHELRMWDTRTGKLISTLWSGTNTKNHIKDICFSPDGQKLAVNFEDFNDGVILILQFPVPYSGPISRPALITLSTDQSIISYGFTTNNELYVYGPPASGEDTWASLWPVRNAAEVCSMIRHRGGQINDIAFSPNQDKIVTAASDKTASLWGLDNGTMLLNFEKHQSDVYAAVFSPDGKRIVTASRDLSARVFKTETGEEQAVIQFKPPENVSVTCFVNCPRHFGVRTVSFSPDGSRILAAASHGTLAVLSLNEEHPVFLQADWQIPDDVSVSEYADAKSGTYGAAFLPDGQRFISAGMSGAIHLWAFDSQSAISKIPIQPERFPRPAIEHLFLGPKGKRALVLTDSGVIGAEQLVNLETSERVVFYGGHNAATMTAAMDPLGTSVATVDTVGTVCIWSTETGKLLRRLVGHRNAIRDVEYSPDGKLLLTASHDGTARLWDVRTGAPVAVLRGHNGAVRRAVFSIDGRQIASAGKGSKAVVYLTHLGDLLKAAETKLPTPRNEEIERRLIKSKRVSWVLFGR